MDIKYYDLLSNTIIGVTIVATINYLFIGNITRTVYGFSIVDWYYAGTLVV